MQLWGENPRRFRLFKGFGCAAVLQRPNFCNEHLSPSLRRILSYLRIQAKPPPETSQVNEGWLRNDTFTVSSAVSCWHSPTEIFSAVTSNSSRRPSENELGVPKWKQVQPSIWSALNLSC